MKYRLIKNRNLAEDEEFAGYNGENRAEKLEFEIPENLRNYAIIINFETEDEKFYDILDEDYTYTLKNNVTKYNFVNFYLKFMKQLDEVTYEIVKTEVKRLRIRSSFETEQEITEEEIEVLDRVLAQMLQATDRANAIAEDLENKVATDYYRGEPGKDALINGMNEIELVAGNNIEIKMIGNKIIISATGISPEPTEDIQLLTSDNKIFITSNNANFIVKESD